MVKFGKPAALVGAAVLALAGHAHATLVTAAMTAEFYQFSGPTGFWAAGSSCNGPPSNSYCTSTVNNRQFVNYFNGGSPYSATFTFDTALGSLTSGPTSELLTWDTGMGASPLLSGSLDWDAVGLHRDLSTATHFEIERSDFGLTFILSGDDFFFRQTSNLGSQDGPYSLTAGFSAACCGGGVYYTDSTYDAPLTEVFSQTLTPVVVPEPASWALMILGFGSVGALLRRRRAPSFAG
jgi:hypothetical protein